MSKQVRHRGARSVVRWFGARRRRWQHPSLARSQACRRDDEIDAALREAGLARADLFTPANAIAHHRVHMAHMLAAIGIDVPRAVDEYWESLKQADGVCAGCSQTGRCRRWLDWGRANAAPDVFCPNAALFRSIPAEQVSAGLGRYVTG